MRKIYREYAYGFNCTKEYKRFKRLFKGNNRSFTYTDWYHHIKGKYEHYEINRLTDFEKYLNGEVYVLKRYIEFCSFVESLIKYVAGTVFPMVALVVSVVTYIDTMKGTLLSNMTYNNEIEAARIFLEYASGQSDSIVNVVGLVKYGMGVVAASVIPLIVMRMFKINFEDKVCFLKNYIESIMKLREGKSTCLIMPDNIRHLTI